MTITCESISELSPWFISHVRVWTVMNSLCLKHRIIAQIYLTNMYPEQEIVKTMTASVLI